MNGRHQDLFGGRLSCNCNWVISHFLRQDESKFDNLRKLPATIRFGYPHYHIAREIMMKCSMIIPSQLLLHSTLFVLVTLKSTMGWEHFEDGLNNGMIGLIVQNMHGTIISSIQLKEAKLSYSIITFKTTTSII